MKLNSFSIFFSEVEISKCSDALVFGSFTGKPAKRQSRYFSIWLILKFVIFYRFEMFLGLLFWCNTIGDCFWDFARCTKKCCGTKTRNGQSSSECCRNRYTQCLRHVTNKNVSDLNPTIRKQNVKLKPALRSPINTSNNIGPDPILEDHCEYITNTTKVY